MNTLESLQAYANKSNFTDKTRLTTCRIKDGYSVRVERRLWIWLVKADSPTLVRDFDLTGSDKDDFGVVFNQFITADGYVYDRATKKRLRIATS